MSAFGAKRTLAKAASMSACDPQRTARSRLRRSKRSDALYARARTKRGVGGARLCSKSERRAFQGHLTQTAPHEQCRSGSMCSSYSLVPVVVAANVLPAIVGLNPAGVIRVVVDWTTKAEREEITVVESMMEVVVKVVIGPCRATVPT